VYGQTGGAWKGEGGLICHPERSAEGAESRDLLECDRIAEREGVELDSDGSLAMDHPLADVQWGVRHVLQYGPDAEVLEPPEVREELARRLSGLVAHE
jgi:predicted DNA-binding transcriptional regulator YafY